MELHNCLLALAVNTTRLGNGKPYFFFSIHFHDCTGKSKLALSFIMYSHQRKEMDIGCIYVKTLEIMCMSRNINLRIQFKPSSSPR